MCFFDLCSLVLGVHLEPVVQSAEFKVLTRETDESCVESSLCASIR